MAICGCGSPACCCQPAVAEGVIYADLWDELSTHLAPQALFTQSSPVREPLLQAFPFPSTRGEVTLHPLSLACVFVYSSRGKWVFPPLLWSLPLSATLTSFPAPDCWAVLLFLPASVFVYSSGERWVFPSLLWSFSPSTTLTGFPAPGCWARTPAPARASPARPSLFIYSSGKDSPPPLFGAQGAPPSLLHVFIVLIAYYSVSLFSPGGGWSVQEAMLFWPRIVCGSTMYHLAHLVHVSPSHLGVGDWQPRGPSGFLHLP
jgi:hypothetical protein